MSEQIADRLGHGISVRRVIDHIPGFTMGDGFGGSARLAGYLWASGSGRLDEHDAETFLFEARPSFAAQHGEGVGAAIQRWQVGVVDESEQPGRRTRLADTCAAAGLRRDRYRQ